MNEWFFRSVLYVIILVSPATGQSQISDAPDTYFKLRLQPGEKIGNIFSRAISFKGNGFKEIVRRVSGTAIYTVMDSAADKPALICEYRYDGSGSGKDTIVIMNKGRTAASIGSTKTAENTDGSGVVFNEGIWGTPSARIKPGSSWQVNLPGPWELGGPGTQKITVLVTDPVHHTITLQREGNGSGFFDNDLKTIRININTKDTATVLANIEPGACHWIGNTIIKDGLILSDELMVTRPVTLVSGDMRLTAEQREYILLNQMPAL